MPEYKHITMSHIKSITSLNYTRQGKITMNNIYNNLPYNVLHAFCPHCKKRDKEKEINYNYKCEKFIRSNGVCSSFKNDKTSYDDENIS